MLRLILSGCNGRMGRAVEHLCAAQPDLEIAAGFDLLGTGDRDFPVFSSPAEFQGFWASRMRLVTSRTTRWVKKPLSTWRQR